VADWPRRPRSRLEHRSDERCANRESPPPELVYDCAAELGLPASDVGNELSDARLAEARARRV
jgi:hypothetical protein